MAISLQYLPGRLVMAKKVVTLDDLDASQEAEEARNRELDKTDVQRAPQRR